MDPEHTGVESAALDAYSRIVTGVATSLLPSVAALSVRTSRGAGAGSAVTFTDDGFLLTNAHVVSGAAGGAASFADGTETTYQVGEFYAPEMEGGLSPFDPDLGLTWPMETTEISEKDAAWAPLSEAIEEIKVRMAVPVLEEVSA